MEDDEKRENRPSTFSQETKNSIVVIAMFVASLLAFLSLMGRAGVAGRFFDRGAHFLLGDAAFLIPFFLFLVALSFFVKVSASHGKAAILGSIIILVSVLGLIELFVERSAGALGYVITFLVLRYLSRMAGFFIFGGFTLIGAMALFDFPLLSYVKKIISSYSRKEIPLQEPVVDDLMQENWQATPLEKPSSSGPALSKRTAREEDLPQDNPSSHGLDQGYVPPPLELLEEDGHKPSSGDIQANKNIIERTLEEFGVEVEMGDVSVGPTVTQYTLRPAQGVNISRITALSRNLSLALAAHPLRIEAPIPGKSLVGIELPNKQAATVRLRSLLQSLVKHKPASPLTLALGRDVAGEPFFVALDSMPHLLVAGATGAGKSVTLNVFITTLLYLNSPRNLRFILIDPKRVEFSMYEGIPHLLAPVVVDTKKAMGVLKWAIGEMEHRYEMLEAAGVRDIKGYNEKAKKDRDFMHLPYLVIIIDEMADLMAKYKREVEGSIVRLAQMARAVGIHLIASTQRPSTDVVTGLIKANITTRVALKVASQIDSRTIIDQGGAEKLLGHGDMLLMSGQAFGLKRLQGTYLNEKEVKQVVDYLVDLDWENEYEAIPEEPEAGGPFEGLDTQDDLYEEAKQLVLEADKASASLLQRRLQVGYARAARLLDMMEEEGVIGPSQGAKPREVIKG